MVLFSWNGQFVSLSRAYSTSSRHSSQSLTLGMMMVFAIESDHQLNGLLLSFHAGRHLGHGFHHDMALKSPLFIDLFSRIRQDQLAGCSGFDAQVKGNLAPAAALFFILFDKCFRLLILKMSQDKNKGHFFFT